MPSTPSRESSSRPPSPQSVTASNSSRATLSRPLSIRSSADRGPHSQSIIEMEPVRASRQQSTTTQPADADIQDSSARLLRRDSTTSDDESSIHSSDDDDDDNLQDDPETGLAAKQRRRRQRRQNQKKKLDRRFVPDGSATASTGKHVDTTMMTAEERKLANRNFVKQSAINVMFVLLWYIFSLSLSIVSFLFPI